MKNRYRKGDVRMTIKELIKILEKYPQHQDVMISCGNCNHGHIWHVGQPVIEDHTDQTFGYINIKILDDKKAGSVFRLVSEGLKVLEQDRTIPRQEKPKEEPGTYVGNPRTTDRAYTMSTVDKRLVDYYIEKNINNFATVVAWTDGFKEAYRKHVIRDTRRKLVMFRCPAYYNDLIDMIDQYHSILMRTKEGNE